MILVGSISGIGEVGLAFVRFEAIEEGANTLPSCLKSPRGGLAQQVVELGEDLLSLPKGRSG